MLQTDSSATCPTSHTRPDILSITEDKLVQITNLGLVKRAKKAIEKADIPSFVFNDDLTLIASFADGHQVTWANTKSIHDSTCTCPALMCRHRVQTVLSYRATHDNPEADILSPHHITKSDLLAVANSALTQKCERLCRHGISAKITQGNYPQVSLPMATVKFWGGKNIHEATCDCILKQGCEHILLASCIYSLFDEELSETVEVNFDKQQLKERLSKQPSTKRSDTGLSEPIPSSLISEKPLEVEASIELEAASTQEQEAVKEMRAETEETELEKSALNDSASATRTEHVTQPSEENIGTVTSLDSLGSLDKLDSLDNLETLVSDSIKDITSSPIQNQLTIAEIQLFDSLFENGIIHGINRYQRLLEDVKAQLKTSKEIWLSDIIHELEEWLHAYDNRQNDFEIEQGFSLIGDYLLRSLARSNPNLHSNALGIGLKQETQITTAQLISLGCRVKKQQNNTEAPHYIASVMLIDNTHTKLVCQSQWKEPTKEPLSQSPNNSVTANHSTKDKHTLTKRIQKQQISRRISLETLAKGQLTCHRAKRLANHQLKLNTARVTYNQVLPQAGDWTALIEQGFDSIQAIEDTHKKRPSQVLRGRYSQPNFIVLEINGVLHHGYDPASQSYNAIVCDKQGDYFIISRAYEAHIPDALPAMVEACHHLMPIEDSSVCKQFVSGVLKKVGTTYVIEPWALITDKLYVLDIYFNDSHPYQLTDSPLMDSPIPYIQDNVSANAQFLSSLKKGLVELLFTGKSNMPSSLNIYNTKLLSQLSNTAETLGFQHLSQCFDKYLKHLEHTNYLDNNKDHRALFEILMLVTLYNQRC